MSQENVEVIRRLLSEWERGNFRTGEFFDPDVHVRWINPIFVHRSETHGLEELGQAVVEFLDAWDHVTATAERIVSAGDKVISIETWRARGRASGVENLSISVSSQDVAARAVQQGTRGAGPRSRRAAGVAQVGFPSPSVAVPSVDPPPRRAPSAPSAVPETDSAKGVLPQVLARTLPLVDGGITVDMVRGTVKVVVTGLDVVGKEDPVPMLVNMNPEEARELAEALIDAARRAEAK